MTIFIEVIHSKFNYLLMYDIVNISGLQAPKIVNF
jgi:hypothetical protein